MRSFTVAALAVSAVLVSAVPITESTSPVTELGYHNYSDPALDKREATQVISQCTVPGQAALTFDDGPYQWESKIISDFGGGKGTFFMNGNNWGCIYDYAEELKAAYAAGWTIGSHGWSHAHMGQITWDQAHNELWLVEQAMVKILGVKPLYFRPPYGEMSDTLMAVLQNRGYKKAFLWSDDTGDTLGNSAQTINAQYDQIATTFPKPHLILNHEVVQTTVDQVVPHAVSVLKNAGYQLVSVDTCLGSGGEWPYVWVGEPQQRDATWVCEAPLRN